MPDDHASTPLGGIPLGTDPRSLIAPNFGLAELTSSEFAVRNDIDNSFPSGETMRAAIHLARRVLQPVREEFGSFSPNSVFRSQALERGLKEKPAGWLSKSQHTRGEAADIEVPGVSTLDLARWVESNLSFDQLICECFNPQLGPNSGWVHVSLVRDEAANRKEILSYIKKPDARGYAYVPGLRESLA